MREMKETGIELIDTIPSDWEIMQFRNMAYIYNGNSIKDEEKENYEDKTDSIPYIATKDIDANNQSIEYENGMYIKNTDDSFKRAPKNSVLLCIEGGSAGKKIAFTNNEVCFINKLCCFNSPNQNSKYMYYYMMSSAFTEPFKQRMSGLIGGVSISEIKAMRITVPSFAEQQRIADFLDVKCADIDSIIENTKASIDEYKNFKLSIITEAVTKGIRGERPMKDSGVEWIGKIPEEWDSMKIKHISRLKGRIGWQGLTAAEYIEEGPYLITGTDFIEGAVNWDTCVHITEERYDMAPEIKVANGDLLITKDGTIGKVAEVTNCPEKATLNSGILLIKDMGKYAYSRRFLYYVIKSNEFMLWYALSQTGQSTIKHLYQEQFYDFEFAFPEIGEQNEIATFLDKMCSCIDALILSKEINIKELGSFKKSLIYECVTGKREIA